MARGTVRSVRKEFDDILLAGYGLLSWTDNPINGRGASNALATQVIFCVAVPLKAGQVVSNIWFGVQVAGTSTAPTGFYAALANTTTILAATANSASSGVLTSTGYKSLPLSASYTVPADGIYYVCFLENGAFAGTAVALQKGDVQAGATLNSVFVIATGGTGKTSMAANDSITLASTSTPLSFWAAVS